MIFNMQLNFSYIDGKLRKSAISFGSSTETHISEIRENMSSDCPSSSENDALSDYILNKYQRMSMVLTNQNGVPDKKSVLVIDDSDVALKVAARVFREFDTAIVGCKSADEGFATLKKNPNKYSFVLLDIMMPGKDGISCLKDIRDDPDIHQVPVYMLTALDDETLTGIFTEYTY